MTRTTAIAALLLACPLAIVGQVPSSSAAGSTPSGLVFPLAAGEEWTYQLTFPAPAPIRHDPYFVNAVLLSSSITHGTTRESHPAGVSTVTIKLVESADGSAGKLQLSDGAIRLWFAVKIKEARFALTKSLDTLPPNHPWNALKTMPPNLAALEVHGVMDMKDEPDPWVLGQVLAVAPTDGKAKLDQGGWLVEAETAEITVPAGSFRTTFHSRIPKGEVPLSPFVQPSRPAPFVIDSWVAPGVGLVKSTVSDENGREIYRLELAGHRSGGGP